MSEVLEKVVKQNTGNVSVVTTGETVVLSSGEVVVPIHTCVVHVRAWAQMTSGAAATGITARLRRGSDATGVSIGEANAATLAAAAGGNETVVVEAVEQRDNVGAVAYTVTVQQAGATGNGSVLQCVIEVEILSG